MSNILASMDAPCKNGIEGFVIPKYTTAVTTAAASRIYPIDIFILSKCFASAFKFL
jgi:hypothetical protein